jgi:hypothetical protein
VQTHSSGIPYICLTSPGGLPLIAAPTVLSPNSL